MRLANNYEKHKVVKILTTAFHNNPTMLFMIRDTSKKNYYIKKIAEYAFEFAFRRNGVYISDSGEGVAICYKYNFMKKDLLDFFFQLKLVLKAFKIKRLFSIMRHTTRIENTRPASGRFFYFWFFAADPKEQPKTSARELAYNIMRMAKNKKMAIYAETTLIKNKNVYERFGFEVYRKWFNPESGFNVWFMRKLA